MLRAKDFYFRKIPQSARLRMGWRREEGRQRSQLRGRRSQLKMMRARSRVEAVRRRLSEEIREICGQPDQQTR